MRFLVALAMVLAVSSFASAAEVWLTDDPGGAKVALIELELDGGPVEIFGFIDQGAAGGVVDTLEMWTGLIDGAAEFSAVSVTEGDMISEELGGDWVVYGATGLPDGLEPFNWVTITIDPLALGLDGLASMPMTSAPGGVLIGPEATVLVSPPVEIPEPNALILAGLGVCVLLGAMVCKSNRQGC